MDYISVSNCSHSTYNYYPIHSQNGKLRVSNINCSMNNAKLGTGIFISSPSSFSSSHCSFSNNNASDCICICFYSTSGTLSMSFYNIVHNNSPSQYGVVCFNGAGSRKMIYCIFQNNQNYLFCVRGGSLEVSHSFIDHILSSFSTSTIFSTETNNSFIETITYQIQFFNSHYCYTDIPPPSRTLDQTQKISVEETIRRTNDITLRVTLGETIAKTIRETSIITPEETIMNTPEETPMNTPENTPMNTPEETPMNTPENTPMNTPENTQMNTPEDTPMNTPENTPMNTPENTPMNTPEDTPMNTPENTPMNTLEDTPMNTPEDTPMNTLEETLLSNSSRVNSLRVVLVSLSIIILIIGALFSIGLLVKFKQDSSNVSNSISDGFISSQI